MVTEFIVDRAYPNPNNVSFWKLIGNGAHASKLHRRAGQALLVGFSAGSLATWIPRQEGNVMPVADASLGNFHQKLQDQPLQRAKQRPIGVETHVRNIRAGRM